MAASFSDIPRLGYSHHWIWQNWTIHYTRYQRLPSSGSFQKEGKAPILLLHGFGASIGHWRHNIQPLGESRLVYGLDLLGFGGSEKPEISYTLDLWVDQVIEFWRSHIGQPIICVGHSIGALVGLLAAERCPEMMAGVCLISCADGPHADELPLPFSWLVNSLFQGILGIIGFPPTYTYLFNWLRQKEVLEVWIKNVYRRKEAVDEDLVAIFQKPAFDPGAGYVFLDAFRAVLIRPFESPKHVLPGLKTPLLVIWGKEDPAVPSFLGDRFKQWQPNLILVKLPGVGHCAHDELPAWVNILISEWSASLEISPHYDVKGSRDPRSEREITLRNTSS